MQLSMIRAQLVGGSGDWPYLERVYPLQMLVIPLANPTASLCVLSAPSHLSELSSSVQFPGSKTLSARQSLCFKVAKNPMLI